MEKNIELIHMARSIPKIKRREILGGFKETQLHNFLKELFSRMESDYLVEVTHGINELGKDLVIVKQDNISTDIFGIVVKVGDIKGKTLGDVDELSLKVKNIFTASEENKISEIESQILQARNHPAEIKTIFAKLPVSKIIVILAGDLSGNARTRIEGEFSSGITIYDMNWLIDKFTEHYPQIYFEAKAVDFLQEKIHSLESSDLLIKNKNKNLSDYYVDPLIQETETPVTASDGRISLKKKNRFKFSEIVSTMKTTKKVIICGDPGSGKSNALTKLAIDIYKEAYKETTKGGNTKKKISIPLFIPAKELVTIDSAKDLKNYCSLNDEIEDVFSIDLLLIDALDEVPPEDREDIIKKAQSCCSTLNCKLILTSRKIDTIDNTPKGFKKYDLLPFEVGQALTLFKKLVKNTNSLETLKESLDVIKYQIPMVPLSLMLLVELVEERKEIPSSVTELYDRFFDTSLGRWDKDKGIEVLFEYLIKKRFLSTLAYKLFKERNTIDISRDEFNSFISQYAELYGWEEKELQIFTQEIERAGIIAKKNTVLFRHRSFLDYFVAFHIYDNRENIPNLHEQIVNFYFDNLWREVSFYYIGLKREIEIPLLKEIMEHDKSDESLLPIKSMIGKLLQAGWHSTKKARLYGINTVLDIIGELPESIIKSFQVQKIPYPKIFADFLVLGIAEIAYDSIFLNKEEMEIFEELLKEEYKIPNLYKMVFLIWCMRKILTESKRREYVSNLYNQINSLSDSLDEEYKARLFLMLSILELGEPAIHKKIRKKLKNLSQKSPGVIRDLIPEPKKGSR